VGDAVLLSMDHLQETTHFLFGSKLSHCSVHKAPAQVICTYLLTYYMISILKCQQVSKMAESLGSDLESDASSADGGPTSMAWSSQTTTTGREQLSKRVDSLQQENRVLKMELDTFRYKCKSLEEENRELKKARVTIVNDFAA